MILGFVEHDRNTASEMSLQALTLARRLARDLNVPLHAVVIGEAVRSLSAQLGSYGVSTVHVAAGDERLNEYAPEAWGRCVVDIVYAGRPEAVLAAGTDRGNEVMAHVGAITGLPMVANCIDIDPGDPWRVTRLRWGGSLLEEAEVLGATNLLSIAPHAVAAGEAETSVEPSEESILPSLSERDFRVRVVARVEPDRSKIALADARVVIGGGRGVGSAEGFEVLEEIAALLGGTVGCSRAVTSLGWRPHSDQVGQTGTRIAPDVYIACGISGAIQHMVGCKSAKCLVAINKDPDAPIVAQADYAIVGDLQVVLPALRDAIRETVKGQ